MKHIRVTLVMPALALIHLAGQSPAAADPKSSATSSVAGAKDICPNAQELEQKVVPGCDPLEPRCTDNSPAVNRFPINGLDAEGLGNCNGERVQLVVSSLQGGKCKAKDANLLMHRTENRLIARWGTKECSGDQLQGARFKLASSQGAIEVEITKVTRPRTDKKNYEQYLLTYNGSSLCDLGTAAAARTTLGLIKRPESSPNLPPPASGDLVIAVRGKLYKPNLEPWSNDLASQWFHLACTKDALGELARQNRYSSRGEFDEYNRAGLHMFTAAYRGKPYTVHGMVVRYDAPTELKTARSIMKEAHWKPHGATCLTEPRLLYAKIPNITNIPQDLPSELQPGLCKLAFPFPRCDRALWVHALKIESGLLEACVEQPADYVSNIVDEKTIYTLCSNGREHASSEPVGFDFVTKAELKLQRFSCPE